MATPRPSSDIAAELAALYILAEQRLLQAGSDALGSAPATYAGLIAALTKLRTFVHRINRGLTARTDPLIQAMVSTAVTQGRATADHQVSQVIRAPLPRGAAGGGAGGRPPGTALAARDPHDFGMSHGERAARAIAADLTSELQDVRFRITRLPDDLYKVIAPHAAIYSVLENDVTPAKAQAAAWRTFVNQGVRGFTDRSGRDWSLSAYVEMAVRTAEVRAYNTSHLDRMRALGVRYFTVPVHLAACPLCFPWQGKVLTQDTIAEPEIPVDATIAEATAAGLFHPNCRHTLLPVLPGVTQLQHPGPWTPELQAQYDQTQRQRRLELEVRKAKRRLEYAYTPEAAAEAKASVVAAQRRVREFVRADPDLHRQTRREQTDLTFPRMKLETR